MRLTLKNPDITSITNAVITTGARSDLKTDLVRVLQEFQRTPVDIFSRKDIAAILAAMGHDNSMMSDPDTYEQVSKLIAENTVSVPNQRGFYTHKKNENGGPIASVAPTRIIAPVPAAADETPIILEIVQVPGTSFSELNLGDSVGEVASNVRDSAALYASDLHLRRLATLRAPCYGEGFSHTAKECQGCPLASRCAVESNAKIGDVVARMDRASSAQRESVVAEERKRLELKRQREEEEARLAAYRSGTSTNLPLHMDPTFITGEEAQNRVNARYGGQASSVILLPFEGLCNHCQQPLKMKTFGVQLPNMAGYSTSGVLHLSCALTREKS